MDAVRQDLILTACLDNLYVKKSLSKDTFKIQNSKKINQDECGCNTKVY